MKLLKYCTLNLIFNQSFKPFFGERKRFCSKCQNYNVKYITNVRVPINTSFLAFREGVNKIIPFLSFFLSFFLYLRIPFFSLYYILCMYVSSRNINIRILLKKFYHFRNKCINISILYH